MDTQERLFGALCSDDPPEHLREAVQTLIDEGHQPEALYAQLEGIVLDLRASGRETEEDLVLDVMDYLAGWCSPQMRIQTAR